MITFDVVQTGPSAYCYDFNLNGSCDAGEEMAVPAGVAEDIQKQAIIDAIVERYEKNSDGCFDHTKNKSPSYDFVLGKTVDVRFFSTWEEYKNIGKLRLFLGRKEG